MDQNTIQKLIKIPAINKEVVIYKYGASEKEFYYMDGPDVVLSCSKLQMNSKTRILNN
jgi:hypothetical protein